MLTTAINVRVLNALSLFAASDPTRYYLCGVLAETTPRATTYVATDGKRFMAAHVVLPDDVADNTLLGARIIPRDICGAVFGVTMPDRIGTSDSWSRPAWA